LVASETGVAQRDGVEIRYGTGATDLLFDGVAVRGVRAKSSKGVSEIGGRAVVLACGGFEANAEWRARYLGPGWELAKVRGTRFNVGDGLRMALAIGAMPTGQWSARIRWHGTTMHPRLATCRSATHSRNTHTSSGSW
jgi:tricarballylate dehydrogenase